MNLRRPLGVYAVVSVEENIKKEQAANPNVSPMDLRTYFVNLYKELLDNYLQIYAADFQYADAHVHAPVRVVESDGKTVTVSAQDLLD